MKLLWPHFVQGGHTQSVVHTDGMKRFIGWNRMGRDRALNESRRWTESLYLSMGHFHRTPETQEEDCMYGGYL